MNESTNSDILDAVTLELNRFTSDVVAEMHRLRDALGAERERNDQLESTVLALRTSLRKYDTQAAKLVGDVTEFSAGIIRRLDNLERGIDAGRSAGTGDTAESVAPPADSVDAPLPADEDIHFAPLVLNLDPVTPEPARDPSIDELVARVVGAIDEPTSHPAGSNGHVELVEPGLFR